MGGDSEASSNKIGKVQRQVLVFSDSRSMFESGEMFFGVFSDEKIFVLRINAKTKSKRGLE